MMGSDGRALWGAALVIGAIAASAGLLGCAAELRAWEPFRSANSNVEEGNARMTANDAAAALAAYDRAARELPSEPGVHLDRGLALLAAGELDKARAAFLLATDAPAPAEIRADAFYDLGLAFYRQADAKAGEENHQEAQKLFREAADALRRSLRARPGNRDAAWNLELALRRIREQEEEQKKKEEEQQAQNEQQQDQQQQDQQQQDQQQQDQQQQDQQQQQQDQQQPQDQQAQNQPQQQDQQQQDQQQQDQQQQDQQQQDQQQQDQQRQAQQQRQQEQQAREAEAEPSEQRPEEVLPGDIARVLDALQDDEDNVERQRARARAMRENRRPTKDW